MPREDLIVVELEDASGQETPWLGRSRCSKCFPQYRVKGLQAHGTHDTKCKAGWALSGLTRRRCSGRSCRLSDTSNSESEMHNQKYASVGLHVDRAPWVQP
ncbi:hypothetical protein U0070_012779 [Myodes glareolus]|uniref:Uncharacterized protein n=1 Tax=Myodes glareolus TaxID=447135 RepID=A0AAW0I863_MYOGA